MTTNNLVEKWRFTGLLFGLTNFQEQILAKSFENISEKLKNNPNNQNKIFIQMIFPIARKLIDINKIHCLLDINILFENLESFLVSNNLNDEIQLIEKFINEIDSLKIQ